MQLFIEQLAKDTGITVDKANLLLKAISSQLIIKIPALQQILDDVFENAEDSQLKKNINNLINKLQEQECREKFRDWLIPQQNDVTHLDGTSELF